MGGRKAGSATAYIYSDALKKSGIVWTQDRLIAFIRNPAVTIPGTKMAMGNPDPEQSVAIAAYLATLK